MAARAPQETSAGRRATPVSMSLMPHERAELEEFTALTEIGPTALYRDLVAPKVRAAVWALRAMQESGMELRAEDLPPTLWLTGATEAELADAYSGRKNVGAPTR